jgi:hypothetical protein
MAPTARASGGWGRRSGPCAFLEEGAGSCVVHASKFAAKQAVTTLFKSSSPCGSSAAQGENGSEPWQRVTAIRRPSDAPRHMGGPRHDAARSDIAAAAGRDHETAIMRRQSSAATSQPRSGRRQPTAGAPRPPQTDLAGAVDRHHVDGDQQPRPRRVQAAASLLPVLRPPTTRPRRYRYPLNRGG